VDPVAEAVPRMLFSSGGRLVLADPALRTQHNRRAPSAQAGIVLRSAAGQTLDVRRPTLAALTS